MNPGAEARDDAALARAAGNGDDRAFTELMRRHKEGIYRFVRRYVGDADEAYDLTQETFAAAWSHLGDFDAKKSMPVWLRKIALNKCRDWSRRRTVRRFFFQAAPLDQPALETIRAPDSVAENPDLARLDKAITQLHANLREALILTALDGLSQKQAAEILGISSKAVETRVARARQALAATLGLPTAE